MQSPYSALPGAGPEPRGLFIDRWGTLLELPTKGYCDDFNSIQFTPGAVDALFHASQAKWNIYLIGNELQVAFGKQSEAKWKALEAELIQVLQAQGVRVQRCYACLEHPDARPPRDNDSVFLLPNTGVLYHAAQNDGIQLRKSWVIGDGTLELAAGWRAGCRLAAVKTGEALSQGELHVEPEILGENLGAVLSELTTPETIRFR